MKQLAQTGSAVVIAVDYSATGRTTGTFADLATQLTSPVNFWLTELPPNTTDGNDLVKTWVAEATQLEDDVVAVLGFCTGAVYAAEIVKVLETTQDQAPRLILFDPEHSSDTLLVNQFGHIVTGKLATAITEAERERLINAAATAKNELSGSALAAQLGQLLVAPITAGLEAMDLGTRMTESLMTTVQGYLTYLGGAVELDVGPAWRSALALSSSTADCGLDLISPADRLVAVERELQLPVVYADLLRDSRTAQILDQHLELSQVAS